MITNPHESSHKAKNASQNPYKGSRFFTPLCEDYFRILTNPHGYPHRIFARFSSGGDESLQILTGIKTGCAKNPHKLHTIYKYVTVGIGWNREDSGRKGASR
jgi:hypothetical protein